MDDEHTNQSQPRRYLGSRHTGKTVPSISRDSSRTILTSSNDSMLLSDEMQMTLWAESIRENRDYLSKQLITYIGNKRALLDPIGKAVAKVKRRLGKDRLRMLDAFSGSGIVSRYFKQHASYLASNDIEDYAATIGRCYLRNRSTIDYGMLEEMVEDLNGRVDCENFPMGFIEQMYSPRCEEEISKNDRVFYTRRNAHRLDNYRRMIATVPPEYQDMLLGPLLSKASIHANTSGVFKGFYKDRETKIGKFGGSNGDALTRIRGDIVLEPPILSRFECEVHVVKEDANHLVQHLKGLDLAYFDPPYNQHPYGSNYFMLNLLVSYERPNRVSRVSGIPLNWQRSDYNVLSRSFLRFSQLVRALDTRFLLVSFNNEGFIRPAEMRSLLSKLGKLEVIELKYNTFRGSRNLRNRSIHVTEHLFLVERS